MPTLNTENIEREFNMERPETVEAEIVENDPFEEEWETENSDIVILRKNIERANEILDKVQEEITDNGNFSARLVEVAGELINSVTAGSKALFDKSYQDKYLDLRNKIVLLKEKEVEIKQIGSNRPTNQNLIIASREDVLKLIEKEKNAGNEENDE